MTTKEVLIKARAELVRRGWYQGWFFDRQKGDYTVDGQSACPVCAWGAVNAAVTGTPLPNYAGHSDEKTIEATLEALDKAVGAVDISEWNDDADQTFGGVLAGFDKAIESLP